MIMTSTAPEIRVGILSATEITFTLSGEFSDPSGLVYSSETLTAINKDSKLLIRGNAGEVIKESGYILFPSMQPDCSFTLHSVTIGVNFHWQRKEDQSFRGAIMLLTEGDKLTAVNIISLEEYLVSVISSEMNATSSEEFLKAHAVVSRSWLIAQMEKSRGLNIEEGFAGQYTSEEEIIRWYDREEHLNYDVCADDHCQRYQGITRASTPGVIKAINDTFGVVLMSDGSVCDSRYYKCCGGITELYESVWDPVNHPYIQKVIDNPYPPEGYDVNLEDEINAVKWIKSIPPAFCNTNDQSILSQVLNDYDQETNDFYRWTVKYKQQELSELVREKTGIDFGTVTDLIPSARGASGRITRLKIKGTRREIYIGKELEIRKALSKTHLYSSCFTCEKITEDDETIFILSGAGWGHGVGLCQIGAAVMGAKGFNYNDILMHYFRGATLERLY